MNISIYMGKVTISNYVLEIISKITLMLGLKLCFSAYWLRQINYWCWYQPRFKSRYSKYFFFSALCPQALAPATLTCVWIFQNPFIGIPASSPSLLIHSEHFCQVDFPRIDLLPSILLRKITNQPSVSW